MSEREWPAEDYAIGSYIQGTISDQFLSDIPIKPTDKVLDIGCGDGGYTRKILQKVPHGSVLGIDSSENMVNLAKNVCRDYPNFMVQQDNVLKMHFVDTFDLVVSFWCLQWVSDIKSAFTNILRALNPGGNLFAILPFGDDPFISGYYALKKGGQFPCLNDFKPPVDYAHFENLAEKLESLPYAELDVTTHKVSILLPDLSTYQKFINGVAFYQGQVSEADLKKLNQAMVDWYNNQCRENWNGEYQFNLTLYLVVGKK